MDLEFKIFKTTNCLITKGNFSKIDFKVMGNCKGLIISTKAASKMGKLMGLGFKGPNNLNIVDSLKMGKKMEKEH